MSKKQSIADQLNATKHPMLNKWLLTIGLICLVGAINSGLNSISARATDVSVKAITAFVPIVLLFIVTYIVLQIWAKPRNRDTD